MSRAIVRAESPEERQYARRLADIERRQRRVAALQADIESLKVTLERFAGELFARFGLLFRALDRVRVAIANYERLIAQLHADAEADRFGAWRAADDPDDADAGAAEGDPEAAPDARGYERAYRRQRRRARLDASAEAELKRLYRELAKRFHPDLARSDAERHRRERLMPRINAAFHDGDLSALRAYWSEAEVDEPTFAARTPAERLAWATAEVARLDSLIADLEAELRRVRDSGTHSLWRRQQAGEEIGVRLSSDLKAKLRLERERLANLMTTYKSMRDQRPV